MTLKPVVPRTLASQDIDDAARRHHGWVTAPGDAAELLAAERRGCLARLASLEQEFRGLIESGSGGIDDEHDPEGATIAYERQHVAALLSQAREHLARIDAAARRLGDGSYGTCERCGQPISAARLAARPAATLCMRCAAVPGG